MGKAAFKSGSCRSCQLRCLYGRYHIRRIKGVQLGNMPVSRLYLVIIPCPLHYLTVLAYLRLGQAVSCSPDVAYCLGILVAAQDIISAYNCAEKGVKYLAVHGRAAAKRSRSAVGGVIGVLGGNGGVCHKAALVIFRQVIKEKLCAFNQSIKLSARKSSSRVKRKCSQMWVQSHARPIGHKVPGSHLSWGAVSPQISVL